MCALIFPEIELGPPAARLKSNLKADSVNSARTVTVTRAGALDSARAEAPGPATGRRQLDRDSGSVASLSPGLRRRIMVMPVTVNHYLAVTTSLNLKLNLPVTRTRNLPVRGSAAAAGESEPTRSPGRPGLGPDGPGFRDSRLGRARAAADSEARLSG